MIHTDTLSLQLYKESRIPSPIQIGLFASIFRSNVSCMPILVTELLQN